MAGKRRAEPVRRAGLPSWAWGVTAVAAVLLLALFTVPALVSGDPGTPSTAPSSSPTVTPSPSPSPTPTPTPSVTPIPTPSATPSPTPRPAPDLLPLSPDQPRRLVIDGLLDVGFDAAVGTSGGTLRPASDAEVSRWADRGSPGSPGEDAVVVIGSMDAGAAFAGLGAVKPGTAIRLRTDQGTLTYTVAQRLDVKASALLQHPELTRRGPGRLVLVGDRATTDLVVVAVLTGASRS